MIPHWHSRSWAGHHVAVIGGAGGIGSALCAVLRAQNAETYSLDLPTFDVTDAAHVNRWFSSHSEVDTIVYAAGLADSHRLASARGVDQLRALFEVNVVGAVTVAQSAKQQLAEVRGRFTVLSSAFSLITADGYGAYSASKAALNSVATSLRHELAPATVTNCILGGVNTEIFSRAAERDPRPAAYTVAGRFTDRIARQTPEQAARTISKATLRRTGTAIVGADARAVFVAHRISPRWTQDWAFRLVGPYPSTEQEQK